MKKFTNYIITRNNQQSMVIETDMKYLLNNYYVHVLLSFYIFKISLC